MEGEFLGMAGVYLRGATIAPSKTQHSSAGLGVFAVKTSSKGDFIGPKYGKMVYQELSFGQLTRKTYENEVLRLGLARFSKCVLQLRLYGRISEPIPELPEISRAAWYVPFSFCVWA